MKDGKENMEEKGRVGGAAFNCTIKRVCNGNAPDYNRDNGQIVQ